MELLKEQVSLKMQFFTFKKIDPGALVDAVMILAYMACRFRVILI